MTTKTPEKPHDPNAKALKATRDFLFADTFKNICTCCDDLGAGVYVVKKNPKLRVLWLEVPNEVHSKTEDGLLISSGLVLRVEKDRNALLRVRVTVRCHPPKGLKWVREKWPKESFLSCDDLYVCLGVEFGLWNEGVGRWTSIATERFSTLMAEILMGNA